MRRMILCWLVCAGPVAAQPITWTEASGVFSKHCTHCHSGDWAPEGLSLDTHQAAVAGGVNGPVAVPGRPGGALLGRLRGQIEPQMPLDGPPYLTDDQIALVEAWVLGGMPDGAPVDVPAPRAIPGPGQPVLWSDVQPIFDRRCRECHSQGGKRGAPPEGLELVSYDAVLQGGKRVAVIPGNVEGSEVWRRVTGLASPMMPLDGPPYLDAVEIRLLRDWIAAGAPDDDGSPAPIPVGREVRLRGTFTGPNAIDGADFAITGATRVDDAPQAGAPGDVRALVTADGSLAATRVKGR